MARYEHITRYIDRIEAISSEAACRELHQEFLESCYEPFVLDRDYFNTLEKYGLSGGKHLCANVETMSLDAAVAALTLIHRSERATYDEPPLMHAFEDGYAVRLLKRIAELDGTWKRPNVVTFYHEYEKDGYLSNLYESPFEFCGTTYPTGEHWMMWQKARVFRDPDMAAKIIAATDQGTVKHLGKQVHGYSDGVWDAVNQQLMRVGLRQKFVQNDRLLNNLLSTGSAVLGEAAGTNDKKWGVGFFKGNPKLDDPANWYGRNLLGRTLADVRSDLRQLSAKDGVMEWPIETLQISQVWHMNLLELTRIPSTRASALMYATIVAQYVPAHFHDARDVLRKVRASIGDIDESMRLNMGGGLPIAGWGELMDELALKVRLGRI